MRDRGVPVEIAALVAHGGLLDDLREADVVGIVARRDAGFHDRDGFADVVRREGDVEPLGHGHVAGVDRVVDDVAVHFLVKAQVCHEVASFPVENAELHAAEVLCPESVVDLFADGGLVGSFGLRSLPGSLRLRAGRGHAVIGAGAFLRLAASR